MSLDSTKHIQCLVSSGLGVWLSTARSSLVRLYHAHSMQFITEVNVAPAVNKILTGKITFSIIFQLKTSTHLYYFDFMFLLTECNDIIRQHKVACLRVTALLACKELLWIGTSAGALCTLQMPMIGLSTTQIVNLPTINGIFQGHTGHVRFLTSVHLPEVDPNPEQQQQEKGEESMNTNANQSLIVGHRIRTLVISGGDGYENFATNGTNEGRDDSTNHLLLWNL